MNSRRTFLKIFFLGISLTMIVLTILTCMQSNLIKEWSRLGAEPWMRATLVDFYFNITLLSCWALYREKSRFTAALWILAFILLGSIATAFYVFLRIAELKPGEPLQKALLRAE